MSAAKLEKKIWNLELRLREEFQMELQKAFAKIDYLEAQLSGHTSDVDKADLKAPSALPPLRFSMPSAQEMRTSVRKSRVTVVPVDEALDVSDGDSEVSVRAERWVPLEPVAFLESTWNLVLVLGFTEAGWLDIAIACLMLLVSAGLQITFAVILMGQDFLGNPFVAEIQAAQAWRQKVAHDYKHMDLAMTSLVSRVCNQDNGLIVSTNQASLISQINSFLGLGTTEFNPAGLRPGILLCMLCILLWCLYLCHEFRAIFISLEAVAQIPRSWETKFKDGRFLSMSYLRFVSYVLARLARATIAGLLLYAGIVWLANTTSISDLMLNAVALGAVLDVDEMFFAALVPKKIQIKIQDLEAIKITYSRGRSQVESVLLVLAMTGLMLWPWFQLVEPLGAAMQTVKIEYCGGNQDFVIGLNENQGVPVGLRTPAYNASSAASLTEIAVSNFAQADDSSSPWIRFTDTAQEFETQRTDTMNTLAASSSWRVCMDVDQWYLGGEVAPQDKQNAIAYEPFWWSTASGLGWSNTSTCSNMASLCNGDDAHLLRLVCPQTCGCDDHLTSPWYQLQVHGCPERCAETVSDGVEAAACQDHVNESQSLWQELWDDYPDVIASFMGLPDAAKDPNVLGIASLMKSQGCSALSSNGTEPMTGIEFCSGHSSLFTWVHAQHSPGELPDRLHLHGQ
ncbi:unnamed protein product [Effrenium voratum]|uniref:Uncharacterized protein n=1 Tax=Effrenium voratum TaxID=2562239 RepID=A0AA36J4Q2_9DINO|nr:unnamed protein product [Effrenium voratum]